jgi:STE24 endopeptidase
VDLPFSLYATFVIEQRFGFNTTTWVTWIKDRLKGLLLIMVLGIPLLSGVLAFFHYTGPAAWIWCWALVTVFMVVVQFIAPTWIMPLFNRFDPLDDGECKAAIMAYARSIDFSLDNIYVMDGSKRSSKSNAFFTGFGRHRRIVLFDTLIARHTTDELVAVLAHEMGHYKMRHILKMMVLGILQTGMLLLFHVSGHPPPALVRSLLRPATVGSRRPGVLRPALCTGGFFSGADRSIGFPAGMSLRQTDLPPPPPDEPAPW